MLQNRRLRPSSSDFYNYTDEIESDIERHIEYDMDYIERASLTRQRERDRKRRKKERGERRMILFQIVDYYKIVDWEVYDVTKKFSGGYS